MIQETSLNTEVYTQYNVDPFKQCALEKTLCESGRPFFLCSTLGEAVIAGLDIDYSSHYIEGNDLEIPFVRYMGTGGPVYVSQEGIFKMSGVVPKGSVDNTSLCNFLIKVMARLGVTGTHVEGTNDVLVNGKKLSGVTCGTGVGNGLEFVGMFISLHVDFDRADKSMRLTKHDGDLRKRAGSLKEAAPDVTVEQIYSAVIAELSSSNFSITEIEQINQTIQDDVERNESRIFRNDSFIKNGYVDT